MEDYRSGDTARKKAAMEELCNRLDSFIGMVIYREYRNYFRDREDLFQCGRLGIIKGMEKYNPEKGAPTTFFYSYIRHEIQDYINSSYNNTSIYYETVSGRLRRAEEEIEASGKKCDDVLLSELSGMPLSTVKRSKSLKYMMSNFNAGAKDENGDFYIDAEREFLWEESAEDIFLEHSLNDTVRARMSSVLSDDEKTVMGYIYGFDEKGKRSVKETAALTGMSCSDVRRTNIRALTKLGMTDLSDYRNSVS